jgi:hypothetical protein
MKYVPSILGVGQLSGKAGSNVASRNRFGSYVRTRVIPVLVQNATTAAVRGNLTTLAGGWRALTDAQRAGWTALGAEMIRSDSLGQPYTLTGFQAYQSVNRNLSTVGGATVSAAPAFALPAALTSITITATSA